MVLESLNETQFEQTSSLQSAIANNPICAACDSKTALITDPSSGERVCQ